jgi:hypothetical protein
MNQSNPVKDAQDQIQKQKQMKPKEYPVRVCCVVWEFPDSNGHTVIKAVKDHAHASGAIYMTRLYDSRKYSDDCNVIQRLPAFHIYINGSYNRTFYPDTPILQTLQNIDECIEVCNRRAEQKKKRKERWSKIYTSFKNWLRSLANRETRLERYEREQRAAMVDTTRFRDVNKNIVPISSWK